MQGIFAPLETDDDAERFLAGLAEPVETIRTSEDVVVSKVGRELYETFFRGYTRKQWGMDPSELDKSVTSRVPTRTNDDDRYFTDTFQAMPAAWACSCPDVEMVPAVARPVTAATAIQIGSRMLRAPHPAAPRPRRDGRPRRAARATYQERD